MNNRRFTLYMTTVVLLSVLAALYIFCWASLKEQKQRWPRQWCLKSVSGKYYSTGTYQLDPGPCND